MGRCAGSSASRTSRWCPSITRATRAARSWTRCPRRSWTGGWSRSSPGTTTSGAIRLVSSISRRTSESASPPRCVADRPRQRAAPELALKKTISEVDPARLAGKTAVVRVDFNVPLDGRVVTDDRRIEESLPTIELLHRARARVVLLSHLGRPDGVPNDEFSLAPVARRLQELVGAPVELVRSANGKDVT